MFAWLVAVSMLLVLLLIWSALHSRGLLWDREAGEEDLPDAGCEPGSEVSHGR